MKSGKTTQGIRPGIGIGTRILLFSALFLLALPWLGYRYIEEMKTFLLQGQQDAQLLAARAVATVLNNRSDLFQAAPPGEALLQENHSLYVYPLQARPIVDGYGSDWGPLLNQARSFGPESLVFDRTQGAAEPATFSLLLGEDGRFLYGFIQVRDGNVIYRHPGYARLDNSDQVRIGFIGADGAHLRYLLIAEAPGYASVYQVQDDWKRALSGQPVADFTAIWRERGYGYDIEFRMPLHQIADAQRLMVMIANVDSPVERMIDQLTATLPTSEPGQLNPLITRSAELDRILRGLGDAAARICVVDRYRRVRAVLGGEDTASSLCDGTDRVSSGLVAGALDGRGKVHGYRGSEGEKLIVAAQPVFMDDAVIGAVLVEKNSSRILGAQRESLLQILIATLLVLLVAVLSLSLFGAWLALRIRRLQRETSTAIDPDGKLMRRQISAESHSRDELGELSRSFSGLLERLKGYTDFLESVPRTLRHEILNPVNTISMSLQKLESAPGARNDPALTGSARNAVRQLELIVQSLTEAAHIDDALKQEAPFEFDLAAMLAEYVANSQRKHPGHSLSYSGPEHGIIVRGSDLRIAQLLDKLKDNALDFAEPGSTVEFALQADAAQARLVVRNLGPRIPEETLRTLGAGMSSLRPSVPGRPHLGIGLFISTRIAQHHGGALRIFNREDADGVAVMLSLPLVRDSG